MVAKLTNHENLYDRLNGRTLMLTRLEVVGQKLGSKCQPHDRLSLSIRRRVYYAVDNVALEVMKLQANKRNTPENLVTSI